MQILSSTTMLCVCVYSIFLFTTICPQQELVGLIVDVVPPSAQGKLKIFEGVHKLSLPPETSPKACSDYYPWFLKRPSNKTSRYIHQQWIFFFLLRFCFVYIKDTLRSIRFQLCFITSMQIHKTCRRRMLQMVNSIVEFKTLCSEDLTHCSQDLASSPSMPHRHSPYHLWLKVQTQLCLF